MADDIVVMNQGEVLQAGSPHEIYHFPATVFVGNFIGSPPMNFFEGSIRKNGSSICFTEKSSGPDATPFTLPVDDDQTEDLADYVGKEVIWGIRPENLENRIFVSDPNPHHSFKTKVEVVEPMGAETYLYLNTGTHSFIARSQNQVQVEPNDRIELVANVKKSHFFEMADKSKFRKGDRNEFDAEKWQTACKLIV